MDSAPEAETQSHAAPGPLPTSVPGVTPAPKFDEIQDLVACRSRERVLIRKTSFYLEMPANSNMLLDHPAVHRAFEVDEYMPYWADLWPAARMLAKHLHEADFPAGLEALEVGCGLGLPGVVALSRGLRVTFSDYDASALRFAAANAKLNGFSNFDTLIMDWRSPPPGLKTPLLLASDLIYEMRNVEPLVDLITKVVSPGGVCLATDVDRKPAESFRQELARRGLPFTTKVMHAGEPTGKRYRGTLYRISVS